MAIQLVSASDGASATGKVQKMPKQAEAALHASPEASSNPNQDQLQQAVRDIQDVVQSISSELRFTVDHESGKTVVRVVDSATQELIRQIPSEEVMAVSHALNRLAGLLVQEKA